MKYVLKKITALLITLLIVSMLSFLLFEVIPGDPASSILGTEATKEKVQNLREEMGLNDPLPQRYGKWLGGILQGDMGTSYSYHIPVLTMVKDKLPITITLTTMSFLFILLFSILLGILSAKYENKFLDRFLFVGNQVTMSIPPFFIGILFTALFGLVFRWFTPGGYVSYQKNVGAFFSYMILPSVAIALPKIAMTAKMLRGSLITEMKQDYVRTAYSRGNTKNQVLFGHALRNALLPVITFLGWTLADIIANSIIVEQVFGIPGLGRILI
ncbi:MAG: ABC transporter permease, partial [Lachnospiraceae bacterium]